MSNEKIKRRLEFILLGSAAFLFCALAVTMLVLIFTQSWKKDWDVVSFTGSIIGGAITLIGVRWTLRNQFRSEFINDYPKKISLSDQVTDEISDVEIVLRVALDLEHIGPSTLDGLREFLKKKKELTVAAATVSSVLYDMSKWSLLNVSLLLAELERDDSTLETKLNDVREVHKSISHAISKIDEYQSQETKKYIKFNNTL